MEDLRYALARLYDEFGPQLHGCALAVTGCGGLAEDAVHDAFAGVLRTGKVPGNLKAYMFRSVRNAAVDIVRRRRPVSEVTAAGLFEGPAEAAGRIEAGSLLDVAAQGLSRLTADEREAVLQHLVAGLTFREIADLQGRPMGTVTSWYHRGLTKLREIMGQCDG